MLFQIPRAVDYLSTDLPIASVPGVPRADLVRSPAAARIGELAAESGLFLFHFEHRATLELPDHWIRPGSEEDAQATQWINGALPERKYQSFRHDQQLGSFHPSHRGKWSTHELCHGLVGFAWRPDATPFFHATAGRLAELLPVVLYYFFDEFRLRRCRDHAGGGALFRTYCARCEAVAHEGPKDWDPDRWIRGGHGFLEKELQRIDASIREGRPIASRWFQIDLSSDGLAYARGHGLRLSSEAFHRFDEQFLVPGGGMHPTLDDLRDRVVEVCRALVEGRDLAPLAPSPEEGAWRWTVQDVAWRLLQIREETDGDAATALDGLIDRLANTEASEGMSAIAAQYREIHADSYLPSPEEVFAVGYPLADGLGVAEAQIRDGLASVAPLTLELFEDAGCDPVGPFLAQDQPRRVPLARRWADWLDTAHDPLSADLARYELALRTVKSDGLATLGPAGADPRVRLAHGAEILQVQCDVVALAEQVESGRIHGVSRGGALEVVDTDGGVPARDPHAVAVGRDGAGELLIADIERSTAAVLAGLGEGAEVDLPSGERDALLTLGLLVPVAWAVRDGSGRGEGPPRSQDVDPADGVDSAGC